MNLKNKKQKCKPNKNIIMTNTWVVPILQQTHKEKPKILWLKLLNRMVWVHLYPEITANKRQELLFKGKGSKNLRNKHHRSIKVVVELLAALSVSWKWNRELEHLWFKKKTINKGVGCPGFGRLLQPVFPSVFGLFSSLWPSSWASGNSSHGQRNGWNTKSLFSLSYSETNIVPERTN